MVEPAPCPRLTAYSRHSLTLYVSLFRDDLSYIRTLVLSALLWIAILLVFFPVVGWGFLGLAISAKLIVASLVLHVLFAMFLWGLCRVVFKAGR